MSNHGEVPSAIVEFQWGDEALEFECFDNAPARLACETILSGWKFPVVPFVRDVSVVIDIGASVGAAAVFFSLAYPDATVFAFEPASEPYRLLRSNADARPNVHAYNFGLRSVREWLAENAIPAIDVLKIHAEGDEVQILEAMSDMLPRIKVVYLEYHSDDDRKAFDRLLGDTHLLLHGKMLAHVGEVTYVAKDAFASDSELDRRPMKLEF